MAFNLLKITCPEGQQAICQEVGHLYNGKAIEHKLPEEQSHIEDLEVNSGKASGKRQENNNGIQMEASLASEVLITRLQVNHCWL